MWTGPARYRLSRNSKFLWPRTREYPEVYPEAKSARDDLHNLKREIDAGASFSTQSR